MRILLLGEYSNVHHTLARALRRAGHEVLLISDGDGWKNYPRDVDLSRKHAGIRGSIPYVWRLLRLLPLMRGYDVAQVINPSVLYLRPLWNRWLLTYLRAANRRLSIGCYGDDAVIVSRMLCDRFLAYTDFYVPGLPLDHAVNRSRIGEWLYSPKFTLSLRAARQADCLAACLYEYWKVYDTAAYRDRLRYLPLPIEVPAEVPARTVAPDRRVRILIGIQRSRSASKGTDVMLPMLQRLAAEHPDQLELTVAENVPFAEYRRLLLAADVLADQLYSYTPAMNALEAMARGTVVITGGEEEYYCFEGEPELRPTINLRPGEDALNYRTLHDILLDRSRLQALSEQSRLFVARHHDADLIARQYTALWTASLPPADRPQPPSTAQPIHVVCATDKQYLPYCAAMLLSLLDTHRSIPLELHVLANDLSPDDAATLKGLAEDCAWHWLTVHPIDAMRLKDLPRGITGYISLTTYSRLLLGSLLPDVTDRVIYLDCDLLVTGSLVPLWQTSLNGQLLAAVEDLNSADGDIYRRLGLDSRHHHYFNAGVLLIDLRKWRRDGCERQAFSLIAERREALDYADQDVLNLIAAGQTRYLPLRYNLMEGLLRYRIPMMRPEAYAGVEDELLRPFVVHFTYWRKPWHPRCMHPCRQQYLRYLEQTPWHRGHRTISLADRLYRIAFRLGCLLRCVNRYRPLRYV